jgi:predicted secreted protein
MFNDKRSKKLLIVAHCILNQNSKLARWACYPGAVTNIAHILIDSGYGIMQMPCPELLFLDLDRGFAEGINTTDGKVDTVIGHRMNDRGGKTFCRKLLDDIFFQVEQYRKHGFEIVGIIGSNGSPTCGVETSWAEGEEIHGPGVFMQMLQEGLTQRGIRVRATGIKAYDPERSLTTVSKFLRRIPD